MIELWPHQQDALQFALPGRRMLAMDMGTGKTLVAIRAVEALGLQRVLVLCPLSVIDVWLRELRSYSTLPAVGLASRSVATKKKAAEKFVEQYSPAVVVVNYESAWREPFASWAKAADFDGFVMDESHRIKDPRGTASRFCQDMPARWRLAMTGTPIAHSPLDIFAQFRALDQWIFARNWWAFRARYAAMEEIEVYDPKERKSRIIKKIVGCQNLDELQEIFQRHSFRVTKDQVLLTLPEYQHEVRHCPLSPKARKIYAQLEATFTAGIGSGEITAGNALVKLLRLQQLTGGWACLDDGTSLEVDISKAKTLAELLADLPPAEPVVVFARFRHDLKMIHQAAAECGRTSAEISGERKELERFNAGGASVLAVQIQSGGLGIDLTRARYAVYYSLGFSLGEYEQSLARLHRPGQTRAVTYYHLIAPGTVDEKVYQALRTRADVVQAILENFRENPETEIAMEATDGYHIDHGNTTTDDDVDLPALRAYLDTTAGGISDPL